MDGLRTKKHIYTLLIFTCVILKTARSLPYPRQIAIARDQNRQVSVYTNKPIFRRFESYQQVPSNSWSSRSFSLRRPDKRPMQNRISSRRFGHNMLPHFRTDHVVRLTDERLRPKSFGMYKRLVQHPQPKLIAQLPMLRPNSDHQTKISVTSGPLSNVLQHPTPRNMKKRHRFGYRIVAKAKSFPGILKDTSLDVTKV